MIIQRRASSPRYQRDDIESFLLISISTTDSNNLSVTLVEMEPGGFQHHHHHEAEQMYFILKGSGMMKVNDEEKQVNEGDCIFIPSNSVHGLENDGNQELIYLSAASPSFSKDQCEELWPLPSSSDLE